jgi:hypothetical protein
MSIESRKHEQNSTVQHNSTYVEDRCAYRFVLLDWFEEVINETSTSSLSVVTRWRPLLHIEASNGKEDDSKTRNRSRLNLVALVPFLNDWARMKDESVRCESEDDDICVDFEEKGKNFRVICSNRSYCPLLPCGHWDDTCS